MKDLWIIQFMSQGGEWIMADQIDGQPAYYFTKERADEMLHQLIPQADFSTLRIVQYKAVE